MSKLFRKPWTEDKEKEKLVKLARKAIQEFYSNPDRFFDFSTLEREADVDSITVCLEVTQDFIRFAQDLRQIAKMIRKV